MISNLSVCDEYIIKCNLKIDHHTGQAHNARLWDNLLSTTSIILSSTTALAMTIMAVLEADNVPITIVGATFAMVQTVVSKVKDSYSFLVLSFKNTSAVDEFSSLKMDFVLLKRNYNASDLEKLMTRYELTVSKNHLNSVRFCYWFGCCFQIK